MRKILEALKPEAAYFAARDGHRGGTLIIDISDPSQIPAFAEPWFLEFEADCYFFPCMTPEDLGKSGIEAIAKKWG